MNLSQLQHELHQAGADQREITRLTNLARILNESKIFKPGLSPAAKARIKQRLNLDEIGSERRRLTNFSLPAGALAVLCLLVIFAQHARPGDTLYRVKRASETTRLTVQPSFVENVVDRRQQELDDLKKKGASSNLIEKTENDLRKAEELRKSGSDDSNTIQPTETVKDTDGSGPGIDSGGTSGSSNSGSGSDSSGSGSNSGRGGSGHSGDD